jgi:Family of unknown function (DUF6412)
VLADVLHTLVQLAVSPASLTALAAVVFGTVTLAVILVIATTVLAGTDPGIAALPLRRRACAFRENARRTAFLRLRDPDARGRTRSRAPSAAPAAA